MNLYLDLKCNYFSIVLMLLFIYIPVPEYTQNVCHLLLEANKKGYIYVPFSLLYDLHNQLKHEHENILVFMNYF